MSPREKRIVLLSALGLFGLAFYFIPSFLYATLIFLFCCFACYYNSGESLLAARLGPNPRGGLNLHTGLRRWLADWGVTGLSVNSPGGTRISSNAQAEGQYRQRLGDTGIYRREALASDSFIYSPRDFLMGSYIGKPESPSSSSVRPRAGRNPREQLREKLSRPNHAVYTPNRRLSFAGESVGCTSRFNITPQRHYPLQQPGLSSVGVLPPVRWDGFRQKNILSPRNSPAAHSPVTVKIARPDLSSPRVDHLSCSRINRTAEDPCSRESVLRVLKESRKREVEDEDRSFTTEQKSKRRRNDSGGSAHSAFEPLLPNGAPSQLVPKPGTLKRGTTSLVEESSMKRSRTSSISSGTAAHASRESSGTRRNAIQSSYSSSAGLNQWKKPSTQSSPLSSPGSSRSQTPDVAFKKPREEDVQSPSSASSAKSEQMTSDKAPATSKPTLVPNVPVTSASDSVGSGGKRKRKIQLVLSNRDDQISLPPPPELGYKVTAKDLDEEKKAAISKIQKVLETPAPEPEKPAAATIPTATSAPSSTMSSVIPTLNSLLVAPLPKTSTTTIPVINLDPSPSSSVSTSTAASSNPLLEALKMKINTAATPASPLSTTTVSLSTTPVQTLNQAPSLPTASQPQSSPAPLGQLSAFTQVLGQISKAPTSSPAAPVAGPTLFGLSSQISSSSAPSTSAPVSATLAPSNSSSSSNPLLVSGFKPIFAAATTTTPATSASESKPPVQNFKPIFGETTAAPAFAPPSGLTTTSSSSTPSAGSTPSIFGALTSSSTAAPSAFSGFNTTAASMVSASSATTQPGTQTAAKSTFGSWSATPPTSSASVQPATTGGTFQFGAAVTTAAAASTGATTAITTSTSQASFPFGVTKPNPQPASQSIFAFGQTAPNLTTTTTSFGGFPMTSSTSTAAPTSTSTQSSFTFGKPAFEAATTQPGFGSVAAAASATTQPGFGSVAAAASATTQPGFGSVAATTTQPSFGSVAAAAATTQPSFGSATAAATTQPSFGSAAAAAAATTQPSFGSAAAAAATTQPSFGSAAAAAATTQPSFGSATAAATTQPSFGSAAAAATTQPSFGSAAAAKPFTFGSSGSNGTPVTNNALGHFAFGGAPTTTAATFGTQPAKPAFGASSTGFAFGSTTTPSAAPSFGPATQTQSSTSTSFAFGAAAPQPAPAGPSQPAPGGFNFGSTMPCPQFGAQVSNSPAPKMGSFNFGAAAADKPGFGTSTPSFGQSPAAGPIPFGSPGTPVQGFNPVSFGSPATPTFSIGAGSKSSGARQRLQARRQHHRKK